jgi:hypothetical protein
MKITNMARMFAKNRDKSKEEEVPKYKRKGNTKFAKALGVGALAGAALGSNRAGSQLMKSKSGRKVLNKFGKSPKTMETEGTKYAKDIVTGKTVSYKGKVQVAQNTRLGKRKMAKYGAGLALVGAAGYHLYRNTDRYVLEIKDSEGKLRAPKKLVTKSAANYMANHLRSKGNKVNVLGPYDIHQSDKALGKLRKNYEASK